MFNLLNIFTPALMRTFYFLSRDPVHSFYQREVAEEAGVSTGSANRILKMLTTNGLLVSQSRGKILLYRFNIDSSVARQLKVLFNIIEIEGLVDELKPCCRRIVLFGSCAQGRDVKESDIDFFVLATDKDAASKVIRLYVGSRALAPILVDSNELIVLRDSNEPLYDEINRGITLWERD